MRTSRARLTETALSASAYRSAAVPQGRPEPQHGVGGRVILEASARRSRRAGGSLPRQATSLATSMRRCGACCWFNQALVGSPLSDIAR